MHINATHSPIQPLADVPLAGFTTLGVGGPARLMVEATQESHVLQALDLARSMRLPFFVLGGGSNLLVSDEGFGGLVLRIALRGIEIGNETGPQSVTVAAGEEWDSFVAWTVARNLAGIECLSGIPGTTGGTPVQNVGAYGQEVSDAIASVRVFDREQDSLRDMLPGECQFAYRSSVFNRTREQRFIVLGVTFALRPEGKPSLGYADLKRYFSEWGREPSLSDAREAVLRIRESKAMLLRPGDPDCRSAGSFFKNPIVDEATAQRVEGLARNRGLLNPGGSLPRYPLPGGSAKLSAAWLIERSGFVKGYRRGRAGISSRHTLALVNLGGATAGEILRLAGEIQAGVKDSFGLDLVMEPVLVGF